MISLFILSSLACNAFAGEAEPVINPPPVITVSAGDELASDGIGAAPTVTTAANAMTSTPAATATPDGPTVTVLVDLNVRTGPGVQYDRVSFLLEGENARIIGTDPSAAWWKIDCPARTPVTDVQCWVSGGGSFSTAVNISGVPVAEVPPTPTPVPPEPQPERAIIGYLDNGRLLATSFNPTEEDPAVAEVVQLLPDETNVQKLFISPGGRRVAYLRGASDRNELRVVNLDGRDQRLLVDSLDLPVEADDVGFSAVIDQVQWLPDGSGLAFSTRQFASGFGGASEQEDLWTVTLDGELTQRLAFHQGGGLFLVLPNNEVILSGRDSVERINLDGSNRIRLISFEFINTASEYIYYPILQLARDGSTVYTAVPNAEPFARNPSTQLWRISGNNAEQIGRLPNTILFHPVQWSANGNRLGYAAYTSSVPPSIIVADGSGQNAETYVTAEQMQFLGWSGDGQHFLYTTTELLGVGQPDSDPVEITLPTGGVVRSVEWLSNNRYIVATGFEGGWRLDSGDVNGDINQLLVVQGPREVEFDLWLP
jgi:Tol biopolymer transport system component